MNKYLSVFGGISDGVSGGSYGVMTLLAVAMAFVELVMALMVLVMLIYFFRK